MLSSYFYTYPYNTLLGQSLLSAAGAANLKIFDKLTSDRDLQTDSLPILLLMMFDVATAVVKERQDIVTLTWPS